MAWGVVWIRAVLAVALCVGLRAGASEPASWLALARISSEEDAALLERVRGQGSDLPVELRAMPGPPFQGTLQERWLTGASLAESYQARAVFWFEREGPELRVHFLEPGGRHLFVRTARVEGRPGTLEWSAGAEAVALVVRSALRAVEAGKPLGEVVTAVAPPSEPLPVEPEPEEVPVPPELWSMPPAARRTSTVHWQLLVGGVTAWDGYAGSGHRAILLASGWELRWVRIRLQFLAGLPSKLRDSRTVVHLQQYTAGLWADVPLLEAGAFRWGLGAGVGVHVFDRSTDPLFQGIEATQPRFTPALLVGPDTSFRWRFARMAAVEVGVALDTVVGRPVLGYSENGIFVPRNTGQAVRPRLGVSLVVLP
ncbi:hypothetical protein LZ198_17065 [Myxococcus sp. K15C18031901]|uniref:hypothetical protein n=1 Tax=Myxococcus dinghuensis TaxID=2906761 RepID=UPI0020A815A5|nr:hypothetical protein [Myxococcus dinghuensis]MCP3100583.1 hypothetical protein [Myxococcus dinghuensis]